MGDRDDFLDGPAPRRTSGLHAAIAAAPVGIAVWVAVIALIVRGCS